MANQAIVFGLAAAGGIMLTAAVTGSSLADIVKGHPGSVQKTSLLNGVVTGTGTAVTTAATTAAAAAGSGASGPAAGVTAVKQVAAQKGWDAQEVSAWLGVIGDEDGSWSLTATNPSTGAYGIAQMYAGEGYDLTANQNKYYQYGGNPDTLVGQLTAMANYIEETYGSPSAALAHENSYHWY